MIIRHASFRRSLLISLLVLSVAAAANAQTTNTPARRGASHTKKAAVSPDPDLEPKAIELLKATSARLAAAQSLSFTAMEVFEQPSRHGHPLAYATQSAVTLRRPDRLRVITSGDGPASEFTTTART